MITVNRRGAYMSFHHDRQADWDWLAAWQPSTVRIMLPGQHDDPMSVSLNKVERVHQACPHAQILLRVWDVDDRDGQAKQAMAAEPLAEANRQLDWWADVIDRASAHIPRELLLAGLINEPNVGAHGEALDIYTLRAMILGTERNMRLGVGLFSAGTPGKPGELPYDMAYFEHWAPTILEGDHVLVVHEYMQPEGMYAVWTDPQGRTREDFGNLINRHIHWPGRMADVPKVIAEWGIDGLLFDRHSDPVHGHSGWLNFPDLWPASRYADEYVECCRVADPSVTAICPFISDNEDQSHVWDSFEVGPAYGELVARKALCEIMYEDTDPIVVPAPTASGAIDPRIAQAILAVESAGSGFDDQGRMKIRFEAHIFKRELDNDMRFDQHFQIADSQPWINQQWLKQPDGSLMPIHTGSQGSEWLAFERAKALAPEAAYRSISMGLAQVMGFNHLRVGYPTARAMFESYASGEVAQLLGLVNYALTDPVLLQAIRAKDWREIARLYNGPGSIDTYAPRLQAAYEAMIP